jgi:hypothetical protein
MKITVIQILFLLAILFSCKEEGKDNKQSQSITIDSKVEKQIDLEPIKSIIQGIWLPKEYVQEIYKSKSAYSAYHLIPDIAEMQINPEKIRNDTLYVGSSLNNHEGYGFVIWFTEQNGKIIINSDVRNWDSEKFDFELKYKTNLDTILQLITKDKKGNFKDVIEYVRIRDKGNITDFGGLGFEYLARKIILNGTYEILDSAKISLGKFNFDAEKSSID